MRRRFDGRGERNGGRIRGWIWILGLGFWGELGLLGFWDWERGEGRLGFWSGEGRLRVGGRSRGMGFRWRRRKKMMMKTIENGEGAFSTLFALMPFEEMAED